MRSSTSRRRRTGRGGEPGEHWRRRFDQLLHDCGLDAGESWDNYVAVVRMTRTEAGQPLARWSPTHLLTALELAVRGRG